MSGPPTAAEPRRADGGRAGPARRGSRWPRPLRRGPLENVCTALILLGTLMLTQPVSLALFGWSFLVILTGTVGFLIVSHFPD